MRWSMRTCPGARQRGSVQAWRRGSVGPGAYLKRSVLKWGSPSVKDRPPSATYCLGRVIN